METSVGAAARLKELEDFVPREEDCAVETFMPKDWPSAGALVLRDLRVGYGYVCFQHIVGGSFD
jgi:hypothetical protein